MITLIGHRPTTKITFKTTIFYVVISRDFCQNSFRLFLKVHKYYVLYYRV